VGDPELLLFEVVEPVPYNKGCGCPDQPFGPTALLPTPAECEIACGWPCERVCGGVFSADLSLHDSIVFSFQAPGNDQLFLRHEKDGPTLRAEFSAKVESCTNDPNKLLHEQTVTTVATSGNDTTQLMQYFNHGVRKK